MNKQPVVVIGDCHGTIDELQELLKTISFKPGSHRVISLGDLHDRHEFGPECLRLFRSIGAEIVASNHDNKAVRWMKHHKKYLEDGTQHPMKNVKDYDYKQYLRLTDEEISYLNHLSPYIKINDSWMAVHGGFQPFVKLEKQKYDIMIRRKYVDKAGKPVQLPKSHKQPEDSYFWSELYDDKYNVIYGHNNYPDFRVRIDRNKNNTCVGVDTASVMGGYLTGALIKDPENISVDTMEFVQIKSKRTYYKKESENES